MAGVGEAILRGAAHARSEILYKELKNAGNLIARICEPVLPLPLPLAGFVWRTNFSRHMFLVKYF